MDRRTYLSGIAGSIVGLSGCVMPFSATEQAPDTSTKKTTTSISETTSSLTPNSIFRNVTIEKTEANGISISSKAIIGKVTNSYTAKVRITWSNPTKERVKLEIGTGQESEPLFSHVIEDEESKPTGLVLVPTHYPDDRAKHCWKPPKGEKFGVDLAPEETVLEPSESVSNTYELWTEDDTDGCLLPGEYSFGHFGESTPWWKIVLSIKMKNGNETLTAN